MIHPSQSMNQPDTAKNWVGFSRLCPHCRRDADGRRVIYGLAETGFDLVQCGFCGLHHLFPVPTAAWLGAYYRDLSNSAAGYYYYPTDRAFYEPVIADGKRKFATARRFMPTLPQQARLLDLGCGSGAFVQAMTELGLRAVGTDFSRSAIDTGRAVFGADLRVSGVDPDPGTGFDLVSFWEVLEHVPDHGAFLADVYARLAPGGYAMGSVPHWGSIARRLWGVRWSMISAPQHIAYFTRETVRASFAAQGFHVEFIGTSPLFATPHWSFGLRRRLHRWQRAATSGAVRAALLWAIRSLTAVKRLSYQPTNALFCAVPAVADHLIFVARRPLAPVKGSSQA